MLFSIKAFAQKDSIVTAIEADTVSIYPNPTKGILKTNALVNKIISSTGLVTVKISSDGWIDVSDMPNGIYFINRKKIIIER